MWDRLSANNAAYYGRFLRGEFGILAWEENFQRGAALNSILKQFACMSFVHKTQVIKNTLLNYSSSTSAKAFNKRNFFLQKSITSLYDENRIQFT